MSTDRVLLRRRWKAGPIMALFAAALIVTLCACSKSSSRESSKTEEAKAPLATPPRDPAATTKDVPDERIPPLLKVPWRGDLDGMVKRRIIRVLVPFRRPEFFYMDGQPVGIFQETFQELERVLNARFKTTAADRIIVAILPTAIDKVRQRMADGFGDIAAFGMSITEQNRASLDFTISTMTGVKIVPVTGPGTPELRTMDDLSGKEIWIHPQSVMKVNLDDLNARLKSHGKPPAVMRETDPMLDPGDVMEMVNAGTYPIALVPSTVAEFWAQVFADAKPRPDLALAEGVDTGWAIQKGTPQLKAFLDDFLRNKGVGTSFGNTLLRRYLKEAKYVKNATEESEIKKFRATAPVFRKYATQYDLEPLLIVAQGYQESGLNQSVKSPVGAVGIMQVMPTTAAAAPVKIPNIENETNNIHAGVRLLHFLVTDYFDEPGIDRFNRTLFAIASYNAGPAKISRCRLLTKEMGNDPNRWFGNVEVAVAKVVGIETTRYVANIYKYYVAYRMASEIQARKAGGKG